MEGRLSGNGGFPYYIELFLEVPHEAALEKNLDVFLFRFLTNMCYKTTA